MKTVNGPHWGWPFPPERRLRLDVIPKTRNLLARSGDIPDADSMIGGWTNVAESDAGDEPQSRSNVMHVPSNPGRPLNEFVTVRNKKSGGMITTPPPN